MSAVETNDILLNALIVIIAALISGLVGVYVSNSDFKEAENKRAKRKVLQQLMANRFNINREGFVEALNQIFVVYFDAPDVLKALNEFHEYTMETNRTTNVANQKLLKLFKAMCTNVGVQIPATDDFFMRPFNVQMGVELPHNR
ncbi:MAG: DUF6680 family protein [Candidatus Bathyarchaeia archaeon]|jgi:hypothetical protein